MDKPPNIELQTMPTAQRTNLRAFQIANWLPHYNKSWLRWDVIAGITLASFVLPESMAYARLAGLPPEAGIYCCLAASLAFALFTTSKQVAVGPTSSLSLLVGATLGVMSGGNPVKWLAMASVSALMVAFIYLVAYLVKLSSLVSFISETILLGFKAGAALSIASTQLPHLFGVHGSGSNFFQRITYLGLHIGESNAYVLLFGLVAFLLLLAGDYFLPGRPTSLFVVAAAIIIMSVSHLQQWGITTVGHIPKGLPHISIPALSFSDVSELLGLAFACFVLGYIETISAARTLAIKHNEEVNARQELLSLAAANAASSLAGGYTVSGGLSQSTVNDKSGARSPISLLVCFIVLGLMLLFLTGLLENLPEVVLASIVLHAILGLFKVKELKRILFLSKKEFLVAMIALVGVLLFGILKGVMIAAIMSIILMIQQVAKPHVAKLGRIGTSDRYSDIERHPNNMLIPGILILRIEASVLYFNCDYLRDVVMARLANETLKPRLVVIDLSASPMVDVGGSKMLLQLSNTLLEQGISLRFVEALASVRDILRKQGLENVTGHISRSTTIEDEVKAFEMGQFK
jgi:high affinity sulfate transporter 1